MYQFSSTAFMETKKIVRKYNFFITAFPISGAGIAPAPFNYVTEIMFWLSVSSSLSESSYVGTSTFSVLTDAGSA